MWALVSLELNCHNLTRQSSVLDHTLNFKLKKRQTLSFKCGKGARGGGQEREDGLRKKQRVQVTMTKRICVHFSYHLATNRSLAQPIRFPIYKV